MVAGVNAERRHLYLVVLDDRHSCDLIVVAVLLPELAAVSLVDLNDDREDPRGNALEQVAVPLFERLGHYGVVGIGKGLCYDVPRLVPGIAAVVKHYPHQLGDSECGVSVVDVDSDLLVQVVKGAVNVHVLVYDVADGGSAQEVLLSESEALALGVIVVRIEHLCNGLRHDVLAERLGVIALVEHIHIEGRHLGLPEAEL